IQSLEIARDDRLQEFRPIERLGLDEVRRGLAGEPASPEPVTDTMRAAVNAGSILSFVSGVKANEKSDVLYSTQFAQRAASAQHNRYRASRKWYETYVDVLERKVPGRRGKDWRETLRQSRAQKFSLLHKDGVP